MPALLLSRIEAFVGRTVQDFNVLMTDKNIFPDGKVLTSPQEMNIALKETLDYARNMMQNLFSANYPDWEAYNRAMYNSGKYKQMLEYKVIALFGLPYGLSQENFDLFKSLRNISEQCGILIVFSYNNEEIEKLATQKAADRNYQGLQEIIKTSVDIKTLTEGLSGTGRFKNLKVTELEEGYPDKQKLAGLLRHYADTMSVNVGKSNLLFSDLLSDKEIFSKKSTDKLEIPIGEKCIDKSIMNFVIGDAPPHYVIGGTSGSGKSNLLHNLIMSACWYYSPQELVIYMMDFKKGTEFNIYAAENLPHAKLIAISSDNDSDYGISVLRHLEEELKRRSELFKKCPNCGDYKTFRKLEPNYVLPRVLLIVDEFQVLFKQKEVEKWLLDLAKQGRSFGVHMIFATQTLKGLDFSNLGTQFSGRVALKCDANDSAMLLGGVASNNIEASEIKIPFAIVNCGSGRTEDNIKFAVPNAEKDVIQEKLRVIAEKAKGEKMVFEKPRVYYGDEEIIVPDADDEKNQGIYSSPDGIGLALGRRTDFEGNILKVSLIPKVENNVLIVGPSGKCREGMLESVIASACLSKRIDRIVYAGIQEMPNEWLSTPIVSFDNTKKMCDGLCDSIFDEKILMIIDDCDISCDFGVSPDYRGNLTAKEGKLNNLLNFFEKGNLNGGYCVAFYDNLRQLNKKCLPYKSSFQHRICYGVTMKDMHTIAEITSKVSEGKMPDNRAVYAREEQIVWFKPFISVGDVENE